MTKSATAPAAAAPPAGEDSLTVVLRDMSRSARRGFLYRVVPVVMTGTLSMVWLGWVYPLCAMVALAIHELVLFPFVYRRIVKPQTATNPRLAEAVVYGLLAVGGMFYCALWLPLMLKGTLAGVFIAASWLWGSVVHNLTYFSRTRAIFIATCAAQVIAVAAAPFFMDVGGFGPWFMLYASAQTLVIVVLAARDRQSLAEVARRDRAARELAEEASVAKSQFLTTMSHELRTPLNAIIGYAEIIEEDHEGSEATTSADDARRVRRAARHLLTLINEVLDLSKIEAGRLEIISGPVDVAALLRDVEETVRPIGAGNGNKVVLDIAGRVPILETDGARLKQCLINLATNACKFTSDGRVTIRAAIENRAGVRVLEIAVIDTGIGISREDQAKLFQPFVQVDGTETRNQDGTGLGLVITRKLAQAMGGDVSLVSTPGIGSTFTLSLPARAITDARAQEKAPAAPQTATGAATTHAGAQVLVIEDDVAAHDLTCRALVRLFMTVECVANGEQGLARIAAAAPALVVLDINLPDVSGWTVLERIKASPTTRDIPVLVVTIEDDRARAMALGACDHMVKPVDRDRLVAAAMRYALRRAPEAEIAPAKPSPAETARKIG
ncbi:MAG: two-component hybrid sensor and regulator [Alphaproteobacteria bacterium]|nr:MAG: two-component hybrid sensor and regulator [Alphaproteobacteria bacterium]